MRGYYVDGQIISGSIKESEGDLMDKLNQYVDSLVGGAQHVRQCRT